MSETFVHGRFSGVDVSVDGDVKAGSDTGHFPFVLSNIVSLRPAQVVLDQPALPTIDNTRFGTCFIYRLMMVVCTKQDLLPMDATILPQNFGAPFLDTA